MPTAINKQKIVSQLFTSLSKHAKAKPMDGRPVLEQFVYAILRENTTRDGADQAFKSLQEEFFDWNEVRVTSALEIAEAMEGIIADPQTRAQRIVDFLQEIFETTYSFDLEPLLEVLQKKGLKQASKQLSRYQAANDYAVAWVMQHSLGGHAIPLDAAALRVLNRMGLVEDQTDLDALRASIEHQVPKDERLAIRRSRQRLGRRSLPRSRSRLSRLPAAPPFARPARKQNRWGRRPPRNRVKASGKKKPRHARR